MGFFAILFDCIRAMNAIDGDGIVDLGKDERL